MTKTGQNDIVATITSITPTTAVCRFNLDGLESGMYNVILTNPDGISTSLTNGLTVTVPLLINSLTPNKAPNNGIVAVNVVGSGFVEGATTYLATTGQNDIPGTISSLTPTTIQSAFDLTGAAPRYNWWLRVKNPDGHSVQGFFTIVNPPPTFTSISPSSVSNTGIIHVTISGGNFRIGAIPPRITSYSGMIYCDNAIASANVITCDLDLTNAIIAHKGKWDVVITNEASPGGSVEDDVKSITGAFEII